MMKTYPTNTDEAQVPAYQLPDPLQMENGQRLATTTQWPTRRAEILRLFGDHVYGRTPRESVECRVETREEAVALGGAAIRKQIALRFGDANNGPRFDLLLYLPLAPRPVPVFLGLNFNGNHTIHADPAIWLTPNWTNNNAELGVSDHRASEVGRGKMAHRWPVEAILKRGYGLATAHYGDLDPDFDDGFANGIHPLFSREEDAPTQWGAIGAWAWGLSRALDFLETDEDVDARCVIVVGHSRLGKAALWAGAQDERFAAVISNNSGCGGAALSRRCFGESVARINGVFPHWFCPAFARYSDRENELPVDQHQLLSLVAPRPLYVASAQEDLWADPRGEWLSLLHADPVYRFLGVEGAERSEMPPLETPMLSRLGYHIRRGPHGITALDWKFFMDFADRQEIGVGASVSGEKVEAR